MSAICLLGLVVLVVPQALCQDPCDSNVYKTINERYRSTGYVTRNHEYEDLICDRRLHPGWYRFMSVVGGQMPTSCVNDFHCGTKVGLWLSGGHPTQPNQVVSRKACGRMHGDCCGVSTDIQVKKCGPFYVYYLVPAPGCDIAYCAGYRVPCPPDKWSPTGLMSAGCVDAYPKMTRPPHLSNPILKSDTFEFECDINFDPNRVDVGFEVTWKFDGIVDPNVPRSHVNGPDRKATLDQSFLQGHMGQSLTCSVSSHYRTSSGRRSPSIQNTNPYWMGIKTSVTRMVVGEHEKAKTIRLISTVPIICDPPTRKNCHLEIYLEPNSHDFKTTTSCTQVLTPADWDPVKNEASTSFKVLAERDFKKDGDKNLVLHFDKIFTVDASPIYNNYQIPFVQIITKDKKTSTCACTGDPHCRTLDRQLLGPRRYYSYYLVGDFVMYRSTSREFEVQVRTWTCGHGRVTCICAVTMREGNDVITIDLCHGSYGKSFPKMTIQHQGQLTQGTVVQKDANGRVWVVYFPSGAWVRVTPGRGTHMNVEIQAPAEDYEATQGLCGTFNSRTDDDLTRKDGTVEHWNHKPDNFTESWRIPSGDSRNMHDNDVKIDPKLNNDLYFCNCHKNKKQVDCKITNKAKVPGIAARCHHCQIVAQGTGFKVNGRRRRQTTYVDSDHHSANNYDVGLLFTPHVPNFPTPSGRTEAQARQICSDTLQRYHVVRQCNTLVNLTFHGEIENCVEDIKISDDVSWAMSSLDAAVMSCMEVVLKDPRFYVTNAVTGEAEPPAFITSDVCPNHCSGHGTCTSGTCTCDAHYTGYDCSIDSSKPPTLHGIVSTNKNSIDSDQCDIQARPCKLVYVIGENIQNSSHLTCRLNVLAYDGGVFRPTGQTINVGVEFKTMYHIGCKMPLRTSVNGHTVVGYNISITNDGHHYSNEVQVFKMDSDCMTCHTKGGACHAKGSPVFEAETELCEYIFNWRTPAACPLKSSTGNDCKVVDPRYNYQFDLSPLRKSDKDYHVKFAGYDYIINVCGPLVEPGSCNLTTGVASCQTKQFDTTFTPIIAGKASSKLKYADGKLTLTYTGGQDKCHGQYERQTTIEFICDQAKNGSDGLKFIAESENCHYLFTWATKHACPPFKVGPCATIDGHGHAYDLSSLARTNDNYDYTDAVNKKRYIFNVCRSLIHKKNATCPYNSAVCMVDLDKQETDPQKYQDVGEPNDQQILYENGRLVMIYDYGGICNGTDIYKTYITFICDKTAVATSPTGHFMVGNCDHHFMWTTAAACPLGGDTGATGTTLPPSQGSCTVRNPQTGYAFNLNSLTRQSGPMYSVDDGKGHMFDFNICGHATHTPCGNTSSHIGVCQIEKDGDKRSFNAGNFAKDLQFDDGVLALNYTGGNLCHGGKFHRNTIFNFVCKSEAVGEPVYVDESDECTYYFAWHTSLACENEIKCTVDVGDSNEIDLSTLSTVPYHLVLGEDRDGSIFYLSVCRPLVPLTGVMCPPGSGVCKIVTNGSMKPMNLGKPKTAPSYNAHTGDITMLYTDGENCTSDPSRKFSSKIVFTCKVGADLGSPVLVLTSGCHFVFQWDTNAVCVGKVVPPSDSCAYQDPHTGALFNLTTLQKEVPYEVTHGGKKYLMNMCGPADNHATSVCNDAMVCLDGNVPLSYGQPKDFDIQPAENMLKLTYAAGGPCADDTSMKAQSHIMLQCDRSAGDGEPEFLTAMGCHVVFLWKTSVVCPPVRNPCAFADGSHMYDLSLLSQDTGSWNLTDASGNRYWINVCGAIHQGPGGECSKTAGACRKTKDGIVDMLGTATSQKRLYFKDGAIVLEYLEGGTACSHKRRSESSAAKTIIKFKCGNTYGGPKYIVSKHTTTNCTFEFTWETKLACEVEREEVESSDGVINDPRSGGVINLRPIMSRSYKYTQTLLSSAVEYIVQLDGNMTDCLDGVVCSRVHGQTNTHLLGAFTNHQFYMDDDILEAVYTSSDKCKGDASRNVSSVIQFRCNMAMKNSTPVLLYQSKDCLYVFTWETQVACIKPKVINPIPGGNSGNSGNSGSGDHTGTGAHTASSGTGGGMKGKTIATIVGIFVVAIALCILLVVFHKPERRAACFSGMRRLVRHRSSQYTQLPQTVNGLQEEVDILDFLDPADTESNREEPTTLMVTQETKREPDPVSTTTLPASYHDDSDEDPLLA